MEGKEEDSVSTGYARLKEEVPRSPSSTSSSSSYSTSTFHRHILIGCGLLVLFTLCGLLGGVIALRVHLKLTSTDLVQTEGQIFAYQSVVNNLTSLLADKKGTKQIDVTGSIRPPVLKEPSVVYFRWGASTCPSTAKLVYEGVTASGGSAKNGGGSNHLCMTVQPDFLAPMAGKQGGRSYIYGAEYRNGADFAPLVNLHGHDAPCAACRAMRRTTVLMIPGATSCPSGSNWTREYFGYLMAARSDLKRTSYICVDANAESSPGSSDQYQHGDLLFPVEALCNENAGGGLPCSPYVNGFEVTCAVCTI